MLWSAYYLVTAASDGSAVLWLYSVETETMYQALLLAPKDFSPVTSIAVFAAMDHSVAPAPDPLIALTKNDRLRLLRIEKVCLSLWCSCVKLWGGGAVGQRGCGAVGMQGCEAPQLSWCFGLYD